MKTNQIVNRVLSVYEVLGGVMGVGLIVYLVYNILPQLSGQEVTSVQAIILIIILLFALGGYILSFLAGLFLWKSSKHGIILSLISQGMQIPQFIILGLSYMFASGLKLAVLTDTKNIVFQGYLGSTFNITYYAGDTPFLIGLNLVAVVIFIYLLTQLKRTA